MSFIGMASCSVVGNPERMAVMHGGSALADERINRLDRAD